MSLKPLICTMIIIYCYIETVASAGTPGAESFDVNAYFENLNFIVEMSPDPIKKKVEPLLKVATKVNENWDNINYIIQHKDNAIKYANAALKHPLTWHIGVTLGQFTGAYLLMSHSTAMNEKYKHKKPAIERKINDFLNDAQQFICDSKSDSCNEDPEAFRKVMCNAQRELSYILQDLNIDLKYMEKVTFYGKVATFAGSIVTWISYYVYGIWYALLPGTGTAATAYGTLQCKWSADKLRANLTKVTKYYHQYKQEYKISLEDCQSEPAKIVFEL